MIKLPSSLSPLVNALIEKGYRPVVVGGYVRDAFLGLDSKDIDIEVFGVESLELLEQLAGSFGKVNSVGRSFGVLKLQLERLEIDLSIPRQEIKVGVGHKGFEVALDATLSFKEAARRRDFTMNAMGFDLKSETLLDPYDGQEDLKKRCLTIVDKKSFIEDPLRLYRAVQFVARFELTVSEDLETLALEMVAQKMLQELPKERLFEEIKKLFLKSKKPSQGFELMKRWGILKDFPELYNIIGVPQDPLYHPEGDVWVHTMMVLDEMTLLHCGEHKKDLYLSFAALCHDLGKANTTEVIAGRVRAIGHENSGLALTTSFVKRLSDEQALLEYVLPLIKHHLKPMQFYKQGAKSGAIRRLSTQVNIEALVLLAQADFLGRTTDEALSRDFKAGAWLLEKAKKLKVSHTAPIPLLQGRDLIKAGMKPSKIFKSLLQASYDLQLEGELETHSQAVKWLENHLKQGLWG